MQVAEEDDGVEALDVDAGFEQVYGAGDEGALAGAAHDLDLVRAAGGGAFEGVVVLALFAVFLAPPGVEVVHLHGDAVGVQVAGAKDDDPLFRPAVFAQELEQVLSLDPRPAYQDDAERIYTMNFADFDVSFRVNQHTVHILKIVLIAVD